MRRHLDLLPRLLLRRHIHRRTKPTTAPPLPPPPNPPRPPQKPEPVTIHGETWHDSYAWMGSLADAAAMRHMDVHMEAEERYAEACLAAAGADRLARKLQLEMASRLASEACTAPARWGPWLYYRRADEGKQYPVLCRRSAALHDEFVSYSDPSAGFDFTAGKRIEQKLVDYNKEAERFGGNHRNSYSHFYSSSSVLQRSSCSDFITDSHLLNMKTIRCSCYSCYLFHHLQRVYLRGLTSYQKFGLAT
jgi:hypothetical protein